MRVFISWSAARSQALGRALKDWLPQVVPGIQTFHSEEIAKGENWLSTLVDELRGCSVGVFCVTPESLKSQWMLFEAGAMAQHGERPKLFTYLYGVNNVSGPLGQFQATYFDRADSLRFVVDLAATAGSERDYAAAQFERTWDSFEARVLTRMILPIQVLVPEFLELFENKKTFHESFADCADQRWDDRLKRTIRTHLQLSRPDRAEILSSDPYLSGAYSELLSALDRYAMYITGSLMPPREYQALDEKRRRQLEDARKQILDLVSSLQQTRQPPVFRESLRFESEPSTDKRKKMIHDLESRLSRDELSDERLLAARDSVDWALDRIIFYAACGKGLLSEIVLADLISALKMEEERARTRNLTRNLQPLYYAAECIDDGMVQPIDAANVSRLLELTVRIEGFLQAHPDRDSGRHIRDRIASIRSKLK
jgi:hypothetical protein